MTMQNILGKIVQCGAPRPRPTLTPFVHDGTGPDVDPATGDEAQTFEPDGTARP